MSFKTSPGWPRELFSLSELFFPQGCGGCGTALLESLDAFYGLCEKCRFSFGRALVFERRCLYCGKPLISEKELCLSCRESSGEKPIAKLWALFPYEGKYKTVLGSYKFEKSAALGNFFALCLKTAILDFDCMRGVHTPSLQGGVIEPSLFEKAAWVPVPPRPGKLKKQGWDQIELLAKRLAKAGPIPVRRCLKRLPSRSQKELNREERGTNLKGRILCVKQPPETAVIFDDIITTGATIGACADALLKGGAKKIYAISLFYN